MTRPCHFVPAPLHPRSLLGWQYRNAVRDLVNPTAAAAVTPPPDSAVQGLEAIAPTLNDIFEWPRTRSVNVIGTCAMRPPCCQTR